MATIEVDGHRYVVIDSLGYQCSSGHWVKIVLTEAGERTVVRRSKSGAWRWWTPTDRLSGGGRRCVGQFQPETPDVYRHGGYCGQRI